MHLPQRFQVITSVFVFICFFVSNAQISNPLKFPEIWQNTSQSDIGINTTNTFQMTIPQSQYVQNKSVLLSTNLYQGIYTVYIHCKSIPDKLDDYKWSHLITTSQYIELSAEEIASCDNKSYYVTVYGNTTSKYSIAARFNGTRTLRPGTNLPAVGNLLPRTQLTETLIIDYRSTHQIKINIETTVDVSVLVINCIDSLGCPTLHFPTVGLQTNYNHPSVNQAPFKYNVTDIQNGKQIIIDIDDSGCFPVIINPTWNDNIPACAYMLNIFSLDAKKTAAYTLSTNIQGHQTLLPATNYQDKVNEGAWKYYLLDTQQPNLTAINFQFNVTSGDVNLYISRTDQFPTATSNDAQLSSGEAFMFTNGTLAGNYYVAVFGNQTGSFMIDTNLFGVNEEYEYAIQLQEDVVQNGTLFPRHTASAALYYKMFIDLPAEWQGVIYININSDRNFIIRYSDNNSFNFDPENPMVECSSGNICAIQKYPNLPLKTYYYIQIINDWAYRDSFLYNEMPFQIWYNVEFGDEIGSSRWN